MDPELLDELKAIEAGDVTDPNRIRQAFRIAEESLYEKLSALYAEQDVLKAAKNAFLEGWPGRSLRTTH